MGTVANLIGEVSDSAYGKVFFLTPKGPQKKLSLYRDLQRVETTLDRTIVHQQNGILSCAVPRYITHMVFRALGNGFTDIARAVHTSGLGSLHGSGNSPGSSPG